MAGAITAVWNMVDAHAAAYDAIKANDTTAADHDGEPAMVSIAYHMRAFYPVSPADPAAVGGYCPRFGVYQVDYTSRFKTRRMGAGARTYRSIIAANTVPQYLFDKYPSYPAPTNNCPRQP